MVKVWDVLLILLIIISVYFWTTVGKDFKHLAKTLSESAPVPERKQRFKPMLVRVPVEGKLDWASYFRGIYFFFNPTHAPGSRF